MSQNQETIEAKLCAFIDGELDESGLSEIEKHLEANPQHRRLLESLKATRELLRWLPREPAPPELAETLQGQLERSVLLHEDEPQPSMKLNRWHRVLAIAASVVLVGGLAFCVYLMMPHNKRGPQYVAVTGPVAAGGRHGS